jgi:hypothetical protein
MTRRTQPRQRGGKQFTALAEFARGYLHEDVIAEHGSAAEAASAFCADASADERRALADDLQRLVERAGAWQPRTLARFFNRLGAAWSPETLDEIRELSAAVGARRDDC